MARLRCELRPVTTLTLAEEHRGEKLYGAFKTILYRGSCLSRCNSGGHRSDCLYAMLFESQDPKGFLFRPSLGGPAELSPRRPLVFELRLFGQAISMAPLFIDILKRLEKHGLEDRAVELTSVRSLDWLGTRAHLLVDEGRPTGEDPLPLDFGQMPGEDATPRSARLEYLTPTYVKHHRLVQRVPTLQAVVCRIRDRLARLCQLWEGQEWQADGAAIEALAANVRPLHTGQWLEHKRHSTRTDRQMPVEGFRGTATYEPVSPALWPLLRIGQEIHIGQHVVWGNGMYRIGVN